MKKLLTNTLKKITLISLILALIVVPVYSNTVPKKDFDEVLNQLIISNDALLKVQKSNADLQEALANSEKDFSAELNKRDNTIEELSIENTALRKENNILKEENKTLEGEKQEILAQLIISNDTLKLSNEEITKLTLALETSNRRLEESNKLLTRDVKYSVGGNLLVIENKLGYGVDFSYLIFKNFSIDVGISYSYPTTFIPSVGISFLW